jgi:hypothetical protein
MDRTPSPSDRAHALNDLVQGEIAAVETYGQAIEKFIGKPAQSALERLRANHVDAVNQLKSHATGAAKPATSSGPWGAFARAVEGAAKLFGGSAALKALQEGEEYGDKLYAKSLDDARLDPAVRSLLSGVLLPRQRSHIATLEGLKSAQDEVPGRRRPAPAGANPFCGLARACLSSRAASEASS